MKGISCKRSQKDRCKNFNICEELTWKDTAQDTRVQGMIKQREDQDCAEQTE